MRLQSINIQHYKSLANVELSNMDRLTVLVGSNAVGKSNTVDAIKFLRDMVTEGLEHAMSTRGGITLVRQHSRTKPYKISIQVEMVDDDFRDGVVRNASYEIVISSLVAGNYKIEKESASWFDVFPNKPEPVRQTMARDSTGLVTLNRREAFRSLAPDQIALGLRSLEQRIGVPVARFLAGFRFSAIFPNTLRDPAKPDTDRILKESGENWASILKSLKRTLRGRESLEHILEMMRVIMPSLEDVTVKTVGSYLVPQFRLRGNDRGGTHDFDPAQLSDGTLRIFGILLALYQSPPPPFMALEEPEQTVHPGVLAMVAEAFREVSERTQLFITSHSPHLIDYFKPEDIRVATMEEGETLVSPIRSSQVEAVKERLISLEELMTAEGLLPE